MPKDDGVIRYLMKEMDPSEAIEFERCMMEDENLLIEVESLRKTLEKTNQLPTLNPPDHLTKTITNQARSYRLKQLQTFRINNIPYTHYAAAAAVVISMGFGFMLINSNADGNESGEQQSKVQQVESAPLILQPALNSAGISDIADQSNPGPWIDRDNIIRFADGYNSNINTSDVYEDEMQASMQKLKPVVDPNMLILSRSTDIQYTGSSTD